jgi:hypothetical protein
MRRECSRDQVACATRPEAVPGAEPRRRLSRMSFFGLCPFHQFPLRLSGQAALNLSFPFFFFSRDHKQYKIELRVRNHNTLSRQTLIDTVVSCVPSGWTVDLEDAKVFILVEVFKVRATFFFRSTEPGSSVCHEANQKEC